MTKVIHLPRWIKMSAQERSDEAYKFAQEFRGSGMRAIRCETIYEYLRRLIFG